MAKKVKASPIQNHLEIKEIKDDVVILKNKGLRAVLLATSINFALKSTEEQDAIIYRYQDFLNSVDFHTQIVVTSRKFDIKPYIQTLKQKLESQENELLKIQTTEYIDFVKGLTQMTNIMTDSFYVIIPYSSSKVSQKGFFDKVFGFFGKKKTDEAKEESFREAKNNLWQRVEFIATGLRGMGIKTAPLNSGELVELFYKLYNPNAKESPELKRAEEMRNQ